MLLYPLLVALKCKKPLLASGVWGSACSQFHYKGKLFRPTVIRYPIELITFISTTKGVNSSEEIVIMKHDINEQIVADYAPEEQNSVITALSKLSLKHVMAQSEWNLLSARKAILVLAQGEFDKIPDLVRAAQQDFRDVIYWVWLKEQEKDSKINDRNDAR